MSDDLLHEQAVQLETLVPAMALRLFTLDPEHSLAELTQAQRRLCNILSQGPRTFSAIGEELSISVSAATQIADRLERAGMVERVPGTDDRRTKYLQLSQHGAELMRAWHARRVQRAKQALALMSDAQRQAVLEALNALREAAIAAAPGIPDSCLAADSSETT